MKQVLFTGFLMICVVNFLTAEKIGVLEDVYHPEIIKVQDKDVYVVEGNKIFIFSPEGLKLKRKFDREGNGPGEFKLDRNRSAAISLHPEMIVVESRFKVVFMNKKFGFIREMKKMPGVVQTVPLKDGYIIHKILYGPQGANYFTLNIYDEKMNMKKELYRQKFFAFKGKTSVVPDGINFCVLNEKIYVERSEEGAAVSIFNGEGEEVNRSNLDIPGIPVNSVEKEKALDHYLSIPALFQAVKQRGKKEVVKELESRGGLGYPDRLPSIRDIKTDGSRIYVKTGDMGKGKIKYIVLDQKGNPIGSALLPEVKRETFFNILQGDKKFYAFYDGWFYYLKEAISEDDEDIWEVHRVKIEVYK